MYYINPQVLVKMYLQNSTKEKLFDAKLYIDRNQNMYTTNDDDTCDYIELDSCKELPMSPNDLSILEVNTQGLVNKQAELFMLLRSMTQMSRIDVVIIVETWLTKEGESRIKIPGYVYIGNPRTHKKGGSVSILIRETLLYKE